MHIKRLLDINIHKYILLQEAMQYSPGYISMYNIILNDLAT